MFEDVLAQPSAKQRLKALVDTNQFPNGLLFYGPRRTGKFALAHSFIKAVQCRKDGNAHCNCPSCRKIDEGVHPDVTIVKPNEKNNITIDKIRAVTSSFEYCISEGKRKMVLIKNADTMLPQATNAVLKTLEEPRGDATLILTTNNPARLLDTIRSRCQLIKFSFLDEGTLSTLATRDDMQVDPVMLDMLGGMYLPELIQHDVKLLKHVFDNSDIDLPDKIEPAAVRQELQYISGIFSYLLRTGKYQYSFILVQRANTERLTRMFEITEKALAFIERNVKPFLVIQWFSNRMHEALR